MRVLLLHDRYHEPLPSGELHVVEREGAILEAMGVATQLVEWPPARPGASLLGKGMVLIGAGYSRRSRRKVRGLLASFAPDIVHIHNFWPQLTPSVYYECRRSGAPVVQTLHNYRILCAADALLRNGQPCELCIGRAFPWPALRHRCAGGSLSRTAVKASAFAAHHLLDTWNRAVDLFIAPSASVRARFVRAGIEARRIVVNPQTAPDRGAGKSERAYFLYAGRLAPEKGIHTLLEAWEELGDLPLRIAGHGVLEPQVRAAAERLPGVRYLGSLSPADVARQMQGAIALLLPSLWEEPAPLVIPESFSAATPVIAADTGTRAESVLHRETGLVFAAGDRGALVRQVRWAAAHRDECRRMGIAARARYEATHLPSVAGARLLSIYERARQSGGREKKGASRADDHRAAAGRVL